MHAFYSDPIRTCVYKYALNYRYERVTGGDGEDVGAGDGLLADGLHLRLDVGDDVEAPQRSRVGQRPLLAGEGSRVIQQHNRCVAALYVRT